MEEIEIIWVRKICRATLSLSLTTLILTIPLKVFGIDLQPNDVVTPAPNKNFAMLSYYSTENSTYLKNGAVISRGPYVNPVIDNQNTILRVTTTYAVSSLVGASYIQLPYGNISPAGSLSNYSPSTGMGDTTLATVLWPYTDRNSQTYLGVAAYLTLPTGTYSNSQVFNMGANRYTSDIQIGFQKRVAGNLDGMLAVDTMWFGGNSQCAAACGSPTNVPLTQKPLTTTQLGPIYKIDQTFTVGASYFYVSGGATAINNNYQNNVVNTQRFLLSGLAYTDIGRFSLQYGRDMGVQNGFIQTRVLAVRYTKDF